LNESTRYLLDTNVISETRKVRPDERVLAFLATTRSEDLFLSALTFGELRKGVMSKRQSDVSSSESLGRWVDGLEAIFADRIRRWGEISGERPLPVIDTLIAATAIDHGLTLVTRNIRDVESSGAALLNPWVLD
jgi:predicted nucleic acid-binding protein